MSNYKNKIENISLALVAGWTIFLTACFCFFDIRTEMHDELSLFNPIYVFLKTGVMGFPSESFADKMVAHPPIYYYQIAYLMKAGFNLFYATTFPVFIMTIVTIAVTLTSRFSFFVKMGLLMGLLFPIINGYHAVHMQALRPDYLVALSWFCGLILLESGRIANWKRWRIFAGSLLLTYASGLHYFAFTGFIGLIFYAIAAIRQLSFTEAKKVIALIAGAGLIFGIPYLLFFVAPNFHDILLTVKSNQNKWGEGGVLNALMTHKAEYMQLKDWFYLYIPFAWTGISVIFMGSLLLYFFKETRLLGLAALPLPLLIYFYSRGKSQGYYIPEMMLFYSSIFISLLYLTQKFLTKRYVLAILLFGISIPVYSFIKNGYYFDEELELRPLDYEMHLARACAKEINGENAFITGRQNLWYISGATDWYDYSNDLLYAKDISDIDPKKYFSQFDAVSDHNAGANMSFTNQLKTVSSWYRDSTLHLKGFYLTNNALDISDIATMSMTVDQPTYFLGFACKDYKTLYKYEPSESGSKAFVVFICPNNGSHKKLYDVADFLNIIPLPDPNGKTNQMMWDAQENLVLTIMDFADWQQKSWPATFEIREMKQLDESVVPIDEMLKKLQNEPVIKFHNSPDEVTP